jgi:hypothetical protein
MSTMVATHLKTTPEAQITPEELLVMPDGGHYKLIDGELNEFLRAGVRLVWVVRPAARAVQVFRSDRSVSWPWAADELSGEDVLPGFRCKVDNLFPKPTHGEVPGPTTSDPVSRSPA